MDWDQALVAFRRYLEVERNYSPRTVEVYLRDVIALRAFLREKKGKDVPLARLSAIDVRGQLAALYDINGAATLNRKLSSVRALCRFLVKHGEIAGNPAAAIRGPKKPKGLPRALDVDDAFRLVEAPGATGRTSHRTLSSSEAARQQLLRLRDTCMLEVLYGTGLRVSEACALDLGDIDRDRYGVPMILVRHGKGDKARQVPSSWNPSLSSGTRGHLSTSSRMPSPSRSPGPGLTTLSVHLSLGDFSIASLALVSAIWASRSASW